MATLGYLLGLFIVPALIPLGVGLSEYLRTGSRGRAQQAAFAPWPLGLASLLLLLTAFAQFVQRFHGS